MKRLVTIAALSASAAVYAYNGADQGRGEIPGGRAVHFSLVGKGKVNTYFNRLATPTQQLVATAKPVSGATSSWQLAEKPGERLYVVEAQPLPAQPLRGELARLDGFAIVSIPRDQDPHTWLGRDDFYAEALAAEETEVEAIEPLGLPEFSLEAASLSEMVIDQQFLETKVKQISGALPVTINGRDVKITERSSAEGRLRARTFLTQEFEALGFKVSAHTYGQLSSRGVNFIAEKAGAEPNRFIVLTAHYDSVGNAGADDNGSGVISALAVAKALLEDPSWRYGLRIVYFDQEEKGLLGSSAYVKQLKTKGELTQVVAAVNLEMTGYDADHDGAFHAIDCNENTSADITRVLKGVLEESSEALQFKAACTSRSDHAAFWRYNKPAIVISENFFGGDSNPCYHRSCDTHDKLNFSYMTKLTRLTAGTLRILLGRPS